jgi:aldehyde dehydrogenase (NAD+)
MATSLPKDTLALLKRLGVADSAYADAGLSARSPITGEAIVTLRETSPAEAEAAIGRAQSAYLAWRKVPAPRRGEFVRLLGEELRAAKTDLGLLVTLEAGKVTSEGLGEVQEMIDICDFAVGLSRQLYGLTIATERPNHRMMETWHPIGVVGVISAFNFPVAVWCWNAALAFVCGDSVVWKPSEKTPLTALAVQAIVEKTMKRFGSEAPIGLSEVLVGGRELGDILVQDHRVPVVSATGSTRMGKEVGQKLAARFARAILELGGNNAAIVAPSADLDIALRGIAFAAMGTAGQRCTTLRRLIVHESVYDALVPKLAKVYGSVKIGDPREAGVLVGPLVDEAAYQGMQKALSEAKAEGGKVHGGEKVDVGSGGFYVRPALVEMPASSAGPVERETFAPILYVDEVQVHRRSDRDPERGRRRPVLLDLHARHARGRALRFGRGLGLRHRQCQYRPFGRRDRRRVWRREGDRRRPRGRLRRLEGLYAPRHQHAELRHHPAAGAGRQLRRGCLTQNLIPGPDRGDPGNS